MAMPQYLPNNFRVNFLTQQDGRRTLSEIVHARRLEDLHRVGECVFIYERAQEAISASLKLTVKPLKLLENVGISEKNKCHTKRLKQPDKGVEQAEQQNERGGISPLQQKLELVERRFAH